MTITVEQLVMVLSAVAAFITSLGVIFKRIDKNKKEADEKLEKAIKEVVDKHNSRQDERTELMLQNLKDMFVIEVNNINKLIKDYAEQYHTDKVEKDKVIQLLKDSLIEAYKNDIRSIYYKLRETGEITDTDKAYTDKIFPKYIALGGNSDIEAKYEELSRVYERRTQEKYDEAFEKTQGKKKKAVVKTEDNQNKL